MSSNGHIKSSPRFFRLIVRAWFLALVLLALCAAVIPAPLQEAADPAVVPNPVKAGWFLLWIQEVVSWSKDWIYAILLLVVFLLTLPWYPVKGQVETAVWFPREKRIEQLIFCVVVILVLLLTTVALFFRGENWALRFTAP